MRGYYERWVANHDGRTAVGNSGIPQRRFRGLVRFLEAYAAGTPADCPERPPDIPVPLFIRYVADDLKAFMLEARMEQRPQDYGNALHDWLWSQTAIGLLLGRVAQRLKQDGEEKAGFGIARGLSRDALAARSGVSASSISRMELDAQRPWRVTLRKLARALGVRAEDLLPGRKGSAGVAQL